MLPLFLALAAQGPVENRIDPKLTSPAAGALWTIPVISIRVLPTKDRTNLDEVETGYKRTVAYTADRIDRMEANLKAMVEEASRFRGYKDPSARPSLGVKVLRSYTFYETPKKFRKLDDKAFAIDYADLVNRVGGTRLIEELGVKEVWVWHYHHGDKAPVESNMASPYKVDVSNSYRWLDDLAVAKHTYTLYGYSFTRGVTMAIHNRGHQLESLFRDADDRVSEVDRTFWHKFVGRKANDEWAKGRAGDCHHPPNADKDYDYHNASTVESDIEDWRPDGGGVKKPFTKETYLNQPYRWPYPVETNKDIFEGEDSWYVYWMQNMPGRGNRIPHRAGTMSNWWQFMGDFDEAMREKARLFVAKR